MAASTKLSSILDQCQNAHASRGSARKSLEALLTTATRIQDNDLLHSLTAHVDRALVVQKKEPSVERFLKCVCAAAANVKEDYFLCFFVRHLLGRSAASNKTVRQRSCEALAELFAQMPKDADMPENLCSDILHALVPRLDDRFPTIRKTAIVALHKLQDASEPSDELVCALVRLMRSDTVADVREHALRHVCVTRETLGDVLERISDVHAGVRRAAFDVLREKVDCRYLSGKQRIMCLQRGLKDRDLSVAESATHMLCSKWLGAFAFDVEALMSSLIDDDHDDVAFLAISETTLNEDAPDQAQRSRVQRSWLSQELRKQLLRSLKEAEINWETATCSNGVTVARLLVLCARVEVGARNSNAELELVPDTVHFVRVLGDILTCAAEPQLRWMMCLCKHLDESDEVGARKLYDLMLEVIGGFELSDAMVDAALDLCLQASRDSSSCLQALRMLVQRLWEAHKEDESAQSAEDAEVHMKLRALQILCWMLRGEGQWRRTASKKWAEMQPELMRKTVDALQTAQSAVRHMAVVCMGAHALGAQDSAMKFRGLLAQICANDLEEPIVRAEAVQALCDATVLYPGVMDDFHKFGEDSPHFPTVLQKLLHSRHVGLVCVGAEVCCRLTFQGKLQDENLVGALLCMSMFPSVLSVEELGEHQKDLATALGSPTRLQQVLSLFFPAYVDAHSEARGVIVKALPSVFQYFGSRSDDQGAASPVSLMVKYVKTLVQGDDGLDGEACVTLALCLCREVLKADGSVSERRAVQREYAKVLSSMDPAGADKYKLAALQDVVGVVAAACTDATVIRHLSTFRGALAALTQGVRVGPETRVELISGVPGLSAMVECNENSGDEDAPALHQRMRELRRSSRTSSSRVPEMKYEEPSDADDSSSETVSE